MPGMPHAMPCHAKQSQPLICVYNRPAPAPPAAHVAQGDRLFSELFNELYQFNLDTRRWYPVALRPPKKSKAEQEAAAAAEQAQEQQAADNGSSDGAAAGGTADQRQQQQQGGELPPGVSPEMHAKLQRMLAEKGGALHAAAARIQANYRGYRVRQVGRRWVGGWLAGYLAARFPASMPPPCW